MYMDKIKQITKNYPRFADGKIDYTNERICFVLNCVVVSNDNILLTRRSAEVLAYPDTINGVSGFIDQTNVSVEDVAKNELVEELDAPLHKMTNLVVSKPFVQTDQQLNREWHVIAVLVEFAEMFTPKINWENKSAEWHKLSTVRDLELMHGFDETLQVALKMRERPILI